MTMDTAGASRHDRQNSTITAPAASRNARKPRSREQLLLWSIGSRVGRHGSRQSGTTARVGQLDS
jgi:hypothetical protein